MYIQCRDTLVECLNKTKLDKKRIFTSRKLLAACNESRIGGVLFEGDGLKSNPSKRIYATEDGHKKRRKKYDREVSFTVVIGEYDIIKVQELYDIFLQELPTGIYVDGNYVGIEPTEAEWFDDEDTILRAKAAVQVKIICRGGVYQDTEFSRIRDVEVEVQKENQDG